MILEIIDNQNLVEVDPKLEDLVNRACRRAVFSVRGAVPDSPTSPLVSLVFVDNIGIQKLNRRFRDQNRPTDVLAFPFPDDEDFWGEVIVSLEKAKEQSERYGHPLNREVVFLALHGFLHLLGHDHHQAGERKKMRDLEEAILSRLGLNRKE